MRFILLASAALILLSPTAPAFAANDAPGAAAMAKARAPAKATAKKKKPAKKPAEKVQYLRAAVQ